MRVRRVTLLATLRRNTVPVTLGGICLLIFAIFAAAPVRAQTSSLKSVVKQDVAAEGTLSLVAGSGPALKIDGRQLMLSAKVSYVFHTLSDPRLMGRHVRLLGTYEPDGGFKVSHFYTVKGGRLYRVRYYCETCNISALEPGNCVCCQQPTELQEIPASSTDGDTVAN